MQNKKGYNDTSKRQGAVSLAAGLLVGLIATVAIGGSSGRSSGMASFELGFPPPTVAGGGTCAGGRAVTAPPRPPRQRDDESNPNWISKLFPNPAAPDADYTSAKPKCTTRFIEYRPSAFEQLWNETITMDIVTKREVCKLFFSDPFRKWTHTYILDNAVERLSTHRIDNLKLGSRTIPHDLDPEVYSVFIHERVCPEGAEGYDDDVTGIVLSDHEEMVPLTEAELSMMKARKGSMQSTAYNEGCGAVCAGALHGSYLPFDQVRQNGQRTNNRDEELAARTKSVASKTGLTSHKIKVRRIRYKTFIEPLVGIFRAPDVCVRPHEDVCRKSWLVIDPMAHITAHSAPQDKFLIDLGASEWGSGMGGASQSWFYEMFYQYGLKFSEVFAWEGRQVDADKFFKPIPDDLKPGYHYFNHYLTSQWGSWDNPLTHMLQRTNRDDFVMLKIDFDSGKIEGALIDEIVSNADIYERIDELFFEHHVSFEILEWSWGGTVDPIHNYIDSMNLFKNMRRLGIRAHSWV